MASGAGRTGRPALASLVAAWLLLTVLLAGPAHAQKASNAFVMPYQGTLKRIADSGRLRIGYRESSPPFAFVGPDGKPIGYALDICELVVDEIAAELRREIKVEYRPVSPENRFDLIVGGEIDLECGSSNNTRERRKIVAFSPTIFVAGTRLLVRRGSGIRSLRDLAGKTLVVTRGTVHAETMPRLAERQKLAIRIVTAADHKESFAMLGAGQADAFANDDVQLLGMLAETRSASDYRIVGDLLTYADYALTLRKDDNDFAEVIDRAFAKLTGSREILAIYDKWFMRPLPSGARLNLPMSPHLEELFRVQGLPSD